MRAALGSLLLLFAACGDRPAPKPPSDTPDACSAAGHNLAGHEPSEPLAEGSPERARLDARLAAACRDDAWSAELIACMTDSTDLADYGPCRSLMSEEQVDGTEGAWADPEATGGVPPPGEEPAQEAALCTTIEALIAAGFADGFESIKGELAPEDQWGAEKQVWAVSLPDASACTIMKAFTFPPGVTCPVAEGDDHDAMLGAYHGLVEILEGCQFPDRWVRKESTPESRALEEAPPWGASEPTFGDSNEMQTTWGAERAFPPEEVQVRLVQDDPNYPFRLQIWIAITPS